MPGTTPTPQMYSSLVDEVVTQEFMRGEWESTKQINAFLERLDKAGQVQFDGSGKFVDWIARIGRFSASRRADLADRSFSRKQHRVTYTAPYSFIEIPAVLSERDVMFMNSPDARVNLTKRLLTDMSGDFAIDVNSKLLTENAGSNSVFGQSSYSGSDVPFYGLPTLFGYGAAAQDYDADAQITSGAIGAGDKEALPNTTYCGVSTHPTNSISGVDNKVNESTSPVLANWSSTAWDGSSTTWKANSTKVLSHLILRQTRGNGPGERPDLGILTRGMYLDFKTQLRSDANLQVVIAESPQSPDAGLHPRLFINYEGVTFVFDVDQPTNTAYVLNTKKIVFKQYPQQPAGMQSGAIKGQTKEMFKVAQMPDIDQGGWKVVATQVAQMICEGRYQGAAFNFA